MVIACGLEAQTGSLTPGKATDIVLLDTDSLNLMKLSGYSGVCANRMEPETFPEWRALAA